MLPILDLEGYPMRPMLARIGIGDPDVRHRPVNRLPEKLKATFLEATKGSWNAGQYPVLAECLRFRDANHRKVFSG